MATTPTSSTRSQSPRREWATGSRPITERYQLLPPLLLALREEAGLTQRDLAGRLAMSQGWVYSCEMANHRVDLTGFITWSEACGVDPRAALNRLLDAFELEGSSRPVEEPGTPG